MTDSVIKILLLEDNPTDVLLLQAALESDPLTTFSITTTERLEQGLSLLDREAFDLILLDLSLPDTNGFDTFEQLHQRVSSLPIIILSGNTDEQSAILAVRAGAQDYIVKDTASLTILARSIRYAVERQQIQLELLAREKYWRTLIEQSVDAITLVAADGTILYKSPAAILILGYTIEEFEGRNAFEFVFPEDTAVAAQSFAQCMSQPHQPVFSQIRFIRKDGTLCWVEATITNWLDDPALAAIVINYRDITRRREAETALRESEARLKGFLDAAPDAIVVVNTEGRIILANTQTEKLFGYSQAELVGLDIDAMVPERIRGRHHLHQIEFFTDPQNQTAGVTQEVYALSKDGREFPAEISLSHHQVGEEIVVLSAIRDITGRKQMQEALRQSEERHRQVSGLISDYIYGALVLPGGTIKTEWLSGAFEQITGYSLEEIDLLPAGFASLIVPEDLEKVFSQQPTLFEKKSLRSEYRLRHKDGEIRWLRDYMQLMPNEGVEKVTRLIGAVQDITERKQTEELVQAQRDLARITGMITSAEAAWPLCLEVALRVSGMDSGGIYLFDQAERVLQLIYQQGLGADFVQTISCYPVEAPNVQLILQGQSSYFAATDLSYTDYNQHERLRSVAIIPIHSQKRVVGCINIASHTLSRISDFARHALETIAAEIGNIVASLYTASLLRESEERFRTLYETMTQGIVYQGAEGSIISANPAAERILGLTLDQMQERSPIDPRWRAIYEDGTDFSVESHPGMVALRTGEPVNNVIMGVFHPQREQFVWININATPQFKPGQTRPYQVYATFEDITGRKLNEDLMQARLRLIEFAATHTVKELLQATLDEVGALISSPIGFYHFVDDDQAALTLQAWSTRTRNEFCTANGEDSHYPIDLAGLWADCAREGRPIIHNDYVPLENRRGMSAGHAEVTREAVVPIIRSDRIVAIIEVGNKPNDYTSADLEIISAVADISWDIVERKRAEEKLRESNETAQAILNAATESVFLMDAEGKIIACNETTATRLGRQVSDMIGANMYDFIPQDVAEIRKKRVAHVFRTGESAIFEDERLGVWMENSIYPIFEYDGQVRRVAVYGRDISDRKVAEEALRESEARAQAMLKAIPDLMFRLDRQGVFLDYKADVRDLYAQSEPTLIGKRNRDIAPPEFADLIDQKTCAALETGVLQTFEYQLDIPGRGKRDYEARMTPSGNGEVLAVVRDITERKRVENALRASEEKYRGLMESLDSVIATVDYEGKFLYLNDIAAAQLGSSPEKLIGQTMFELFPEPVATEQLRIIRKAIREDQGHIYESPSFVQGQFRWYRTFIQPIHDETGHPIYALINSTDIHDLKTAQQELQEWNRTLEERVKERTTDLSRANAELARAARAKDEFLANMSHELRTPLNAILGLSEALLEQVRGPLNERQQASIRNIEASGRHLLALISDILDLSKVEAGRLELLLDVVSVAEVCQASMLFVREAASKKQLQLAFHLNHQLAKVQADPKRLKQMLVNLLSNAVKFTPEGGQVSLGVTADAEAGAIRFAVQDSGIGITPEGLARLFQPFTQLDSSLSRQYEGTGLGLALVRRLAELHGGSVSVESEGVAGQGSRFTISLPYNPLASVESKPIATPQGERKVATGALRSALVVEDSESAAEQLARYLQETNVHAIIHSHGDGALEQAIQLHPDIIFLDLLMPDQTGWEVLAQLKADPRTYNIPVIIVSVVDERAKGVEAGAAGYMVKPVSREMLRQTLVALGSEADSMREALVIVPEVEPVGMRILLAEDNELNIEAFEDYLRDRGYEVVVARNGREAVVQALEIRPDLVLMDIQMPELDGLEAIRRLRARSEFAATPIIALTALAMPGDRERCLSAGASEYLTKPIKLKGLVEIIEKLLQQ